jgi:biopolymer transport protein ExbB/TolQ
MINGIQDKTKDLEKYYELYEEKFDEKSKWRRYFQKMLDTIVLLFPNIRDHRWRNKSDFYTLFMALRQTLESNYLPAESVDNLRSELIKFSNTINEATKKENKGKKFPPEIRDYSNAVTKSTTDKDRRLTRHKITLAIVGKHVKKVNTE